MGRIKQETNSPARLVRSNLSMLEDNSKENQNCETRLLRKSASESVDLNLKNTNEKINSQTVKPQVNYHLVIEKIIFKLLNLM